MSTVFEKPRVMRILLAFMAALILAFALAACGDSGNNASDSKESSSSDGTWPRTVTTDDEGEHRDLKLDAQPKRIVSTSTTLTGSLLAIDAPVVASAATVPNSPGLSDDQGFFSQWGDIAKERNVAKLYENASPNVEKAADYDPDLIIVAKNSGDSVYDQVDQLRKIAPVMVVDYSGASWQDVTKKLGEATGHEQNAEKAIKDFESRQEEVKKNITVPSEKTSAFIVFGDGSGAAALTKQAPQVQILENLGFTMTAVPDEVKGNTSMGKRSDIIELSKENVQKGLPGEVWIAVSADDKAKDMIKNDKAFNTSDAVKNNKVYYTPGETFRLDYYSAKMMLDSLEESFKK